MLPRWLRIGLLTLLAIGVLIAVVVPSGYYWLTRTASGRAFVAQQVAGVNPRVGLRFQVERIDGDLGSRFTLVNLVVRDLEGVLLTAPAVEVDWRPRQLFSNNIDVNSVRVAEARMLKMWKINPSDPNEPLLPDIDIRIGRYELGALRLEPAVVGTAATIRSSGNVDIRSGRVLANIVAATDRRDGLKLLLDTEPDRDRFDLDATLDAPADGLVMTAAGFAKPLSVRIGGRGSFSRWEGRALATLAGAEALDLNIVQAGGRTRLRGLGVPATVLAANQAALLGPRVAFDAVFTVADRAVAGRVNASSDTLRAEVAGGFDIDANEYRDVRATVAALRPGALYRGLSGRGLAAVATITGPRARPAFTVDARAASIAFAGRGAEGLAVTARGTYAPGEALVVPVTASARRLFGLPEAAAELAGSPRAAATLRWANGVLTTNDARITTARARATGSLRYVVANGAYDGRFKANVARYAVPGQGAAALDIDAAYRSGPRGVQLAGRLAARALSIANAGAREFLGGLPRVSLLFDYAPDGRVAFSGGSLSAPKFSLANARGTFDPATGAIVLNTEGRSADYGPLSVGVTGTLTAPTARVRLARPGFGIGLTDVDLLIAPADGGYLVTGTGASPQGPLAVRVRVLLGRGPLSLDIQRVDYGGLVASGRLIATAAGPYEGRLAVTGSGLDATLLLSATGRVQAVNGAVRADGARLPLTPPVQIARGRAAFRALLVPGAPQITGQFEMTGVRRGALVLTRAAGTANLVGTQGTARVTLTGQQGAGPRFSANLGLAALPQGYRVGLDGNVGRLPLRLAQPAEIVRVAGGFELRPARLVLPKGQVDVQGRFGRESFVRANLVNVDLSIAELAAPTLRLGGAVSGGIDLRLRPGEALPTGAARLVVRGLTRAGLTTVSPPVDVNLAADFAPARVAVGANLVNRGVVLGRMQATVLPGPGDTAAERFADGAIGGGVRYNGPAEALWALSGLQGQELKGGLAVGADFAGTVSAPRIQGVARGRGLTYTNATLGTSFTDVALDARFTGTEAQLVALTAKAGSGTLSLSGNASFATPETRRVDLLGRLTRAQVANSELAAVTLSGPVSVTGQGSRFTVGGDLVIDAARAKVSRGQSGSVPKIAVRRKGEIRVPEPEEVSASNIALDVRVRAGSGIIVEGMGLDSEWRADIRARGTATAPILTGTAQVIRGTFEFSGNEFELTRGRIGFNGAPLDSSIDILAQTTAQNITATVAITGTANNPNISFGSVPQLPQDEVLARLLFGSSVTNLSLTEAVQLGSALASLQGGGGGFDPIGSLRRAAGIDRLKILGDSQTGGRGAGIAVGKRLGRNLYVEVTTDSQGNAATQIQLALSRALSLLAQVGSFGQNAVNLRYSREY